MRGTYRHLELFSVVIAALSCWGVGAMADDERWMPTQKNFKAEEQGETCQLLRSLETQTRRELTTSRSALERQEALLRTKRQAIEECGRAKGITTYGELEEARLAELCRFPYASWIEQGYQFELVKEDLKNASGNLVVLEEKLKFDCSGPGMAPSRPIPALPSKREAVLRKPPWKPKLSKARLAMVKAKGSELPE